VVGKILHPFGHSSPREKGFHLKTKSAGARCQTASMLFSFPSDSESHPRPDVRTQCGVSDYFLVLLVEDIL